MFQTFLSSWTSWLQLPLCLSTLSINLSFWGIFLSAWKKHRSPFWKGFHLTLHFLVSDLILFGFSQLKPLVECSINILLAVWSDYQLISECLILWLSSLALHWKCSAHCHNDNVYAVCNRLFYSPRSHTVLLLEIFVLTISCFKLYFFELQAIILFWFSSALLLSNHEAENCKSTLQKEWNILKQAFEAMKNHFKSETPKLKAEMDKKKKEKRKKS